MEVEYEGSDADYDNRDVDYWLYSSVLEGWESSQFRMKIKSIEEKYYIWIKECTGSTVICVKYL